MLTLIREGVRLPWNGPKPKHLRDRVTGECPMNNSRLSEEKDKVWDTLYKQLKEGAVTAWG